MITVSYNTYCMYCAITKGGDNDIWTVRPRGVVLLLPLCSQIDVGATMNALLGDTFSHENNTHGSRFHDWDPHFASRILGAMTQSCYIGTHDIRSRVIRGLYCMIITYTIVYCVCNEEFDSFCCRFTTMSRVMQHGGCRIASPAWETKSLGARRQYLQATVNNVLPLMTDNPAFLTWPPNITHSAWTHGTLWNAIFTSLIA